MRKQLLAFFALAALAVGAASFAMPAPPVAAQEAQAVAACPVPPPNVQNGVDVCVDRGEGARYYEGEPIRICVTVNVPVIAIFPPPPAPLVRVTDVVNGALERVLLEERFNGHERCIDGVVAAPFGTEQVVAEVIGTDGRTFAQDRATFYTAPRSQPVGGSITVDRGAGGFYRLGEGIHICYAVPGPGPVTITDILADGRTQILLSGFDDGRGNCFWAVIAPPTGTECLRLDFSGAQGSGTRQVCFHVSA
jgi:hypothetical protein